MKGHPKGSAPRGVTRLNMADGGIVSDYAESMKKNKPKAEDINRQLMNTVRNVERGGDTYARNYDIGSSSSPKNSIEQRADSRFNLKHDIRMQAKAAKKASKR